MTDKTKCLIAAIAGIGMVLWGAGVTHATEPNTSGITTVLWEVTSTTEDVFLTPQNYVDQYDGDWLGKWDNPTSGLKCGTKYQADAYPTGEVAKLIEDGLLYGGEDNGIAQHWYVWTTPACEVVVTPTPTPTETPEPVPSETPQPAPTETPEAQPTPAPSATPETQAPATPDRAEATSQNVDTKMSPPVLAETGVNEDFVRNMGIAALILVIIGAILGLVQANKTKRKDEGRE